MGKIPFFYLLLIVFFTPTLSSFSQGVEEPYFYNLPVLFAGLSSNQPSQGGSCLLAVPEIDSVPAPIIRNIHIHGNTRTRTGIIRRELLFSVGDSLDAALLAETERNLRQLLFLGQVDVRPLQRQDGVDIQVQVQDLYARALSPQISGKPGELSYALVALDYNFLGRAQVTRLTLDHRAIEGNSATLDYQIPRLFDGPHNLTTRLGKGAEGHRVEGSLSRPFHTLSSLSAYGLSLYSREDITRLYAKQLLAERYTDRLDGGSLWYTHSLGQSTKFRPTFRLSISDRRFTPSSPFSYAPQDRRRVLPSTGFTVWRPRYEKARFIRTLGPIEDIQIGSWLSTRWGFSHRDLGSDRNFHFFSTQLSPRFKPHPVAYSFATLYLSGRRDSSEFYHIFSLAELLTYVRLSSHGTLALRLRADALHRPEDASQLLLGLDNGLRGYPPRRFDGSRRFLGNLEYRPIFKTHPLYILAGALFAEGGAAWTPSHTSPSLNLAVGLGGRLGLPQVYDTPVLRADLAWGFRDRALQLSFGVGQFF